MNIKNALFSAAVVAVALLLMVLVFLFDVVLKGFVIQVLWGWFITPLGPPPISVPLGYGLGLLAWFVFPKPQKEDGTDYKGQLATSIANAVIALLFGYIVHSLFM